MVSDKEIKFLKFSIIAIPAAPKNNEEILKEINPEKILINIETLFKDVILNSAELKIFLKKSFINTYSPLR